MSFLWPEALWGLALLPLLVLVYVWLLRRKRKSAVRYANLGMIKEAMGVGSKFRRHVPPAIFLLAIAAMIVGMARPVATVTLPTQKQTIVMALDNVRAHKFRSFLTTLGVVIGVLVVILISSILTGLRTNLIRYIEDYGTNNIYAFHLSTGPRTGEDRAERLRKPFVVEDAEAGNAAGIV